MTDLLTIVLKTPASVGHPGGRGLSCLSGGVPPLPASQLGWPVSPGLGELSLPSCSCVQGR